MRVLVACEESQEVCKAFRARGHEAYSCDIQDCSGGHPEWHLKCDVLELLKLPWDLIIAHPPCTYLTKAGANRLVINGTVQEGRFRKGIEAKEFFMNFLDTECKHVAVENPIPNKRFGLPPYTQIIQPFYFGDPYYKTTCLWLKGLPPLFSTCLCEPIGKWVNCTDHRKNKQQDEWSKSGVRTAKARSKTFPGIARAMAEQWG